VSKPWFPRRERKFFAPEVVQTSSMDCGPAALKCLLDGHGVPVSYGRLREACQTSVDGTSIDTIEVVAAQLGLNAEQVLIPRDFICLDGVQSFPAMVVVRHSDDVTHFVVVWARHGKWLQIMDPAVGRRWISLRRFEAEIFSHEQSVDALDWRQWCESDDFQLPMQRRLANLGFAAADAEALIAVGTADSGWFSFGSLDAAVRLCMSLVEAGGLSKGKEAAGVATALFRDTVASGHDIYAIIPPTYWSAKPDADNTGSGRQKLKINGGVVLKTSARHSGAPSTETADLPPELAVALVEETLRPLRHFWQMLRSDGGFRPLFLSSAIVIQTLALLVQAMLFRGLLEVSQELALPLQRVAALVALAAMAVMLGVLDLGIASHNVRLGRRLEAKLREAIFTKLPRLKDRYFQSRPITDMADRNHNIHSIRGLPALAFQLLQALCDLALTFVAMLVIAPDTAGWAIAVVVAAIAIPSLTQPLLNERDLRLRNHGGALHGFYLDALLGLAPIRAHRAQQAIARQHESLLVEWARAAKGIARFSMATEGLQVLICTSLVGGLLLSHFAAQGALRGSDLLLVFWALKLPAGAGRLSGIARRYPGLRNALLRQMEPLSAPEEDASAAPAVMRSSGAASITIRGGRVVAGGHEILRNIDLSIAPGEHVAIVGKSGAGKSSILGLLLGWHRLEAGSLLVDGRELSGEAVVALRQQTAWLDPQVQIWNRTLLENLTYAVDDRNLAKVRTLIEASGLMGVSSRLSQGLQTPLGEGGGLLSGGEGQRVRLGRALLSDSSRLALLDEPFRGLDRTQRRQMIKSARGWWKDTTLLCVTHDIEETMEFDRVLVIEDGQIVEDGDPAQLSVRPTRYSALRQAEKTVMNSMWGASRWRRVQVADGSVTEAVRA
jgi:ABC-type bacteriocin/lantibiotic exporter with double-glycine peptidase domain